MYTIASSFEVIFEKKVLQFDTDNGSDYYLSMDTEIKDCTIHPDCIEGSFYHAMMMVNDCVQEVGDKMAKDSAKLWEAIDAGLRGKRI